MEDFCTFLIGVLLGIMAGVFVTLCSEKPSIQYALRMERCFEHPEWCEIEHPTYWRAMITIKNEFSGSAD